MNSASQTKELLSQDKKYLEAVAQCNDELKNARDSLELALRSNMNTLTNPAALTPEEIDTRIKKIMAIIAAPVTALPEMIADNVDDLRKRLNRVAELYDQLQPSYTSKLVTIGLSSSPRETIKSYLNTVGIRETIDPCIHGYLLAQSRLLAEHMSYYHAKQQAAWIAEAQKNAPHAFVEILLLNRHEVCLAINKGLGLKEDAGLDAITLGASQSKFSLNLAQLVKKTTLTYLQSLHPVKTVEMTVSPVARAYQTALYGSFSPQVIHKVTIDPHFAEEQLNTSLIASGRASRSCSTIADDFKKEHYSNVSHTEDFFIHGENGVSFLKRLNIAFKRLIEPASNPPDMHIVMGHSTLNMHLLKHLRYHTASNNIPAQPSKLDFGGYYYLILLRNEGCIVAVDYKGSFDRYGQQQTSPAPLKMLLASDYIKRLDDEDIPQAATLELKAALLFHRCIVDDNEEAVKTALTKPDMVDLLLDHLSLLDWHTTKKAFFILKTLTTIQLKRIDTRMKEESTYSLGSFYASFKNTVSGKHPRSQYLILNELLDLVNKVENSGVLGALKELVIKSERTCYEGKVTNLCRAVRDWETRRQQGLSPLHQKNKAEKQDDNLLILETDETRYVPNG